MFGFGRPLPNQYGPPYGSTPNIGNPAWNSLIPLADKMMKSSCDFAFDESYGCRVPRREFQQPRMRGKLLAWLQADFLIFHIHLFYRAFLAKAGNVYTRSTVQETAVQPPREISLHILRVLQEQRRGRVFLPNSHLERRFRTRELPGPLQVRLSHLRCDRSGCSHDQVSYTVLVVALLKLWIVFGGASELLS